MVRRLALSFFILFCSIGAMAMDAVVAHTVFYMPDPLHAGQQVPKLEMYWQINPNTLHYVTNDEKKIVAKVKTDIYLSVGGKDFKEDHFILQTVPRNNLNELLYHTVIDLRKYQVPTGMVRMRIRLTDMADSANRYSFTDSFMVEPPQPTAFYSGIELLDTSYDATEVTPFTKNGKQQVPVCANFIDDGVNTVRYFAELYNSDKIDKGSYPLVQKVAISKNATEGFYGEFLDKDTIREGQSRTYAAGKFGIASLPSGNYYMRVWLENAQKETIAGQSLFFQRLNKHPYVDTGHKAALNPADTGIENVTVLNLKKTFLAKYSMGEVRAILKMLIPFSDQRGRQTIDGFLKKPDEMYMRYYIYNYFSAINKKDPGKAWKDFTVKITEVNKLYNTHNVPGYETERGAIYLRYGPPTEVTTIENEQGTLPYEVWQYNVLSQLNGKNVANAIFLFYKPNQMTSDYRLLHTTVAGEVINLQWRNTLYNLQNGGSDYSGNRVEQLLGNR